MQPLNERLRAHYQSLSPQERRVADFILDHYDDLISYNSAELARLSGVSKPTVSRLFKRLGYSGYKVLRDELRALRQSGVPLADARGLADGDTLPARHYQQEVANLNRCLAGLDAGRLGEAASALASAGQVLIVGQRNAYPVALHLRQQLIQARGQVRLAPQPGQTLAEELVDLTSGDLVVVVAFRRRPRVMVPLLKSLRTTPGAGAAAVRAGGPATGGSGALAFPGAAGQPVRLRQLRRRHEPGQPAGQRRAAPGAGRRPPAHPRDYRPLRRSG